MYFRKVGSRLICGKTKVGRVVILKRYATRRNNWRLVDEEK